MTPEKAIHAELKRLTQIARQEGHDDETARLMAIGIVERQMSAVRIRATPRPRHQRQR